MWMLYQYLIKRVDIAGMYVSTIHLRSVGLLSASCEIFVNIDGFVGIRYYNMKSIFFYLE